MEVKRLLATLKDLTPVLSPKFSPLCGAVTFTGKHLWAAGEVLTAVAPFRADLAATVPGEPLFHYLAATSVSTVSLLREGDHLLVKAKRSRLKLPCLDNRPLPEELSALRSLPDSGSEGIDEPSWTVQGCLARCVPGMGTDPTHLWRYGVAVEIGPTGATFWSSDNVSLTCASLACPQPDQPLHCVLPPPLCKYLLTRSLDRLDFGDQWASAHLVNRTWLRCPTFPTEIDRYKSILEGCRPEVFVPVPSKLGRALKQILAVDKKAITTLAVSDGRLVLTTEGAQNTIVQKLKLENHPDVTARTFAELVQRSLDFASEMAITHNAIVVKGENFTQAISNVWTPSKDEASIV